MVVRELRSLIYAKYDRESDFALVLGWDPRRLNKITNGTKEPNIRELNTLASALNVTVNELAQIFLSKKSPNGQHS